MIKARANIPEPDVLYCSYCFYNVYECERCFKLFKHGDNVYCDDAKFHYCKDCYEEIKE